VLLTPPTRGTHPQWSVLWGKSADPLRGRRVARPTVRWLRCATGRGRS